jgi:lipopolysaccharide/colanic/teichoic acid biosynthesis glycosyltransferase
MTMSKATRMLSRAFDALVSTILLLLTSPIMILVALAIRCDSPGPAIFAQQRLGLGCKPFAMHKFRTLKEGSGDVWTIVPDGDARVTRVGRLLRRIRVDELPQLLDVLIGRMALVGPRPEVPANLGAVGSGDRERLLSVRPGLTGPTQLQFIAEDELLADAADPVATYRQVLVPAKVRHDLAWLAERSFLRDLLVLLRTPMVLVSRRAWGRSRVAVERIMSRSDWPTSDRRT